MKLERRKLTLCPLIVFSQCHGALIRKLEKTLAIHCLKTRLDVNMAGLAINMCYAIAVLKTGSSSYQFFPFSLQQGVKAASEKSAALRGDSEGYGV